MIDGYVILGFIVVAIPCIAALFAALYVIVTVYEWLTAMQRVLMRERDAMRREAHERRWK